MSYLTAKDVQSWLQASKYHIASVDTGLEAAAVTYTFGELAQRYGTSSWVNAATTPDIVKIILAMQVASYELRRAAGEEDGRTTYADYLDSRSSKLVDAIVSGAIILDGQNVNTNSLGAGPAFYPSVGAELLSITDPDYAPLYFRMSVEF